MTRETRLGLGVSAALLVLVVLAVARAMLGGTDAAETDAAADVAQAVPDKQAPGGGTEGGARPASAERPARGAREDGQPEPPPIIQAGAVSGAAPLTPAPSPPGSPLTSIPNPEPPGPAAVPLPVLPPDLPTPPSVPAPPAAPVSVAQNGPNTSREGATPAPAGTPPVVPLTPGPGLAEPPGVPLPPGPKEPAGKHHQPTSASPEDVLRMQKAKADHDSTVPTSPPVPAPGGTAKPAGPADPIIGPPAPAPGPVVPPGPPAGVERRGKTARPGQGAEAALPRPPAPQPPVVPPAVVPGNPTTVVPPAPLTPPPVGQLPRASTAPNVLPPGQRMDVPFGPPAGPGPGPVAMLNTGQPPLGAVPLAGGPTIRVPGPSAATPQVQDYSAKLFRTTPDVWTFEAISTQFYRSSKYARALCLYNDVPSSEAATPLQVGTQVLIPPATILQDRFASVIPEERPAPALVSPSVVPMQPIAQTPLPPTSSFPTAASPPPLSAGAATRDLTPTYQVRGTGEMLYEIARQTLGDGKRWAEIYRLNPNIQPELPIPGGTVLHLPAGARLNS